jgi:hypothetical protein
MVRRLFAALMTLALPACLALTSHDGPWPCSDDSDCPSGKICLPHDDKGEANYPHCGNWNDCSSDWDCYLRAGPDWHCDNGTCSAPKCSPVDCVPYLCDTRTGCATSCGGGDCAYGAICSDGACIWRPCTGTGQCDGRVCVEGRCATECSVSGCESGLTCEFGECTCYSNPSACGRYACVYGKCNETCYVDENCAKGVSTATRASASSAGKDGRIRAEPSWSRQRSNAGRA